MQFCALATCMCAHGCFSLDHDLVVFVSSPGMNGGHLPFLRSCPHTLFTRFTSVLEYETDLVNPK